MHWGALLVLAAALAMDAFAVAVCKGLAARGPRLGPALTAGAWFGGFQGVMPLLGSLLAARLRRGLERVDHWVAFGLLTIVGLGMLLEKEQETDGDLSPRAMLPLAVATSLDAMAAGITLTTLGGGMFLPAACIAAVSFLLSALGYGLGGRLRPGDAGRAKRLGGGVLIVLGLRILAEHLR